MPPAASHVSEPWPSPRRAALLVLIVSVLLLLPPLGQRVIVTSHEARFAVLAQDVLRRQAWFEARVGGEVYRNKPPLLPWSIAALSVPLGRVSEATAQTPGAVAALATVLLTFLLGRALWSTRAGVWAGLVLLTSYDFFAHSQLVLPDMLVVMFVTAAGLAFWRAISGAPSAWPMAGFHAAVALGVFSKGPVGFLPLLVAGAWLWSEHGARGLRRLWSPAGFTLFTVITLAWLAPFLAHGSASFARRVLWTNWLEWFVGLSSPKEWAAFAMESVLGLLPWTLLLPVAVVAAGRAWRAPAPRFVLLWLMLPAVLIALSSNPRARYILPVYPAAALLIAWWADTRTPASTLTAGWPARLLTGVAASTAVALAIGIWPHTRSVNRTHDFPRAAAVLSHHAAGTEPVAYVSRRFYQMDFYLGRELRQVHTVTDFNTWMQRPERPVALVNRRNWDLIAPSLSPDLVVLATVPVGDEDLLIVRDGR